MNPIRLCLVILLPLLFLIGAACGGDEEATAVPEQPATAAPAAAAAPTTAPAAAAAPTTASAAAPTTAPAAAAAPTTASAAAQATVAPQPTAVPTAPPAGAEPVASRLRIAFRVPVDQVVVPYKAFITSPLMRPTYDQLIWNNRLTNAQEPMLATEWFMSSDAKNWTFKLREGVPFHDAPNFDGGEFTANDVVRSYDLMFSEGHRPSNIPAWKERVGGSENIDVVSDYEVVFRLIEPWPTLNFGADEEHQNTMGIYSADYWDGSGQETYEGHPVGTGPWKFVEIRTNEYILWERFKEPGDDHWWKIPEFSEMQVFFVPEHATRLAMLTAGEAHMAELPTLLIDEAARSGFEINRSTLPGTYLFGVFSGQNHSQSLLNGHRREHGLDEYYWPEDPMVKQDVREALNLAINRELLKDTFFQERVAYDAVHGMHTFREPWDDGWVPYEYNPDRAMELLAEAGFPDGFDITVLSSDQFAGWPEGGEVAEAIASMWNQIGVGTTIENREANEVYLRAREFNITRNVIAIQMFPVLDLELLWNSAVQGPGSAIFYDQNLADLFNDQYQPELDTEERRRLEISYGQSMYDQYATIPLFARFDESAYDPGVIAEYSANYGAIGITRHHEFTVPVYK